MTRIRLNADGTRTLLSWSHCGVGDPDHALRKTVEALEESNAKARAEWESLSPQEQQRRIAEFEANR